MRATAPDSPPRREQPPDLVGQQEQRGHRGGVVGLVLGGVVDGDRQVEEAGDPAAGGLDLGHPVQGVAGHERDPQPAVGGEGLLRREVVDVGLRRCRPAARPRRWWRRSAPARRRRRRAGRSTGAMTPVEVSLCAQRVDVDAVLRRRQRQRAGLALGDHRVGEERRLGDAGGELGGELAVGAEARARSRIRPKSGGVPERRRPAVAEHDLVAVGQVEQLRRGPRGSRRTRFLTGACRCEVPMTAAPSAARACSASGRTLDGPQPNRPSAGRSSAGMVMLIRGVPLDGAVGRCGRRRPGPQGADPGRRRQDVAQAGATWVVVLV